jgi:3-oxoacyl-[acyl-carrier-protein] synthase-3
MAVRAGAAALRDAGTDPGDVGLLVHSWVYHQGQDYWDPVHYIVNGLALPVALPLGVSLGCNGGLAAVETAGCRLAHDGMDAALVTTAERFCLPGFDRWGSGLDIVYGDSATAEVLSTFSVVAADFETMYRAPGQWSAAPFESRTPVDLRSRIRGFMAAGHGPRFVLAAVEAVRRTVATALALADIAPDDPCVQLVAAPRIGAENIERGYTSVLAGFIGAKVLNLGRHTGHLGAGDTAANLAVVAREKMLAPGQVALLLTATVGFSWSCMVVRAV